MSLEELVDRVIEVTEELDLDSINYERTQSLGLVLNKLMSCYMERCASSEINELDSTCWKITFKRGEVKHAKSREVLGILYFYTASELQKRLLILTPKNIEVDEERKQLC